MNEEVISLLRKATLQLLDETTGELMGSGFFIARGLVLTAAHVVDRFNQQPIWIRWAERKPALARLLWMEPPNGVPGLDVYPLPDLAVLYVQSAESYDHPCVMLADKISGSEMLADGYTEGVTVSDASPDPVRVTYEGIRPEPGGDLIKCKGSLADPGMSGGPLLDLSTGLVVGVVKAQRSPDLPIGLYAAAVNGLLSRRPDLWATCQLVHQSDKRWRQAIRPGSTVHDPQLAVSNLLEATLHAVERRTWNLPRFVDRDALHQTVWVRHAGRATSQRISLVQNPAPVAERFRWRPLHVVGKVVVVRGLPGYGKSWLLAYHVETVAKDSLQALEANMDPDRLRLPIILDCATLGACLSHNPDQNDVISALLSAAGLSATTDGVSDDCSIIAKDAFETGRLVICLDGLDEVPVRFRRRVQKALAVIAAGPANLMVTTRHTTLHLLDDISAEGRVDIETLGFTPREASRFIGVWLERNPERHAALEHALESSTALRDLSFVPLLLSFLCRLADDPNRSGSLPTSRNLLYQDVIEGILSGRWRGLASRSTLDPEWPSATGRRLRVLAESLGALLDSWRSSGDRISRTQLSGQLAQHPDYEHLRGASIARWNAWQLANEAEPTDPPPDPVLWEFIFDGLVVAGASQESEDLQVLHPSLRDFLLATYLAELSRDTFIQALDRHRWFDTDWQEIFALASSLMADPDAVIEAIMDVQHDPWLTQAIFAARCISESAGRVSDGIVNKLVERLLDTSHLAHLSDVRRSSTGFAALVRSGVAPAVSRALEICDGTAGDKPDLYLEAVSALADLGNPTGLSLAQELITEDKAPRRYRRSLITSLASTEDETVLTLITDRLHRDARRGDLDAFLAAIRPQSERLVKTAVRLLRTRDFTNQARTAVAAALLECGNIGTDAVLDAARDATLEWSLRCHLFALLINAGIPSLSSEAMILLRNPNLVSLDKSYLIQSLLQDGEFAALSSAAALILDRRLAWQRRAALASAICAIGADGVSLLHQQIIRGLPLNLTVRHVVALVEIRDPEGLRIAVNISLDDGVSPWVRAVVLLTLWRWEPSVANVGASLQVAGDSRLDDSNRIALAIALARAGAPESLDAIRAALDRGAIASQWPQTSRMLGASESAGRRALAKVAADTNYPWEIRCEAVLALAATAESHEASVVEALAAVGARDIPELWLNRLRFGFTGAGHAQFVEEVIRFLPEYAGAYEAVYRFMSSPSSSLEFYFDNLAELGAAMSMEPKTDKVIPLNADLLASCGISWSSEGELEMLLRWFYQELETRVGQRLAYLMLPHQLDEFESYIDDRDDRGAFDWLANNFPEYQSFTRDEFERLQEDIRAGRKSPPDAKPDPDGPSQQVVGAMRIVLERISKLIGLAANAQWGAFFDFLGSNDSTLLSDFAGGLLNLAASLDQGWPLHEAVLFCVYNARREGISETARVCSSESFILERVSGLLDQGAFDQVYLAGSFAALRYKRSAPCFFYAGIGAEGIGMNALAEDLILSSGSYAARDQVTDGSATLGSLVARFAWEVARVEELIEKLEEGYNASHSDDGN